MKIIFILIFVNYFLSLHGQPTTEGNNDSSINVDSVYFQINQDLSSKIPDGYNIFQKLSGDLNHDGLKDSIFIVKATDTINIVKNRFGSVVDRNRRGLLIFLSKKDKWELVIQNLDCFSSENEDGGVYIPPDLDIYIEANQLMIYYRHGRYGYLGYTFEFNETDFELTYYESYASISPVTYYTSITKIDFRTRERIYMENINEDAKHDGDAVYNKKVEKLKHSELVKLSEINDFHNLEIY